MESVLQGAAAFAAESALRTLLSVRCEFLLQFGEQALIVDTLGFQEVHF